jgi:hypothetical protein
LRALGFGAAGLLAFLGLVQFGIAVVIYSQREGSGALAQVSQAVSVPTPVAGSPTDPPAAASTGRQHPEHATTEQSRVQSSLIKKVLSESGAVGSGTATATENPPGPSAAPPGRVERTAVERRTVPEPAAGGTAVAGTAEPTLPTRPVEPVTPPHAPAQCVKVTPPSNVVLGQSAVFKASLCDEDGAQVTLWFRAIGGTWQSRLMPLALGSHTQKILLDETFRDGLEFYIQTGAASQGTASQPMRVEVSQ